MITPLAIAARKAICQNCPVLATCKQSERVHDESERCPVALWPGSGTGQAGQQPIRRKQKPCRGCP